jgi:uncharacterized membrane protein
MSEGFKIVAKPNSSLSKVGMYIVVGIVAFLSLAIALAFSLMGAWLVLPFAGLELILVAGAFYHVQCHSNDFESITIIGDELALDKRSYKQSSRVVLNCGWAKVLLHKTPSGDHALCLRSHGKDHEFGKRLLHDEDRVALAQELKKHVGVSRIIA